MAGRRGRRCFRPPGRGATRPCRASDPPARRSPRPPRGGRRMAAADPVGDARRAPAGRRGPRLHDRGDARGRPPVHFRRPDVAAPIVSPSGSARLGIRAGDVVSWQLPNWFEGAALAVAIDRIGAVSNPIITIYREREVGVRLPPGALQGAGGAGRGARRRPSRAGARRCARQAPDLEHVSPCAPRRLPASARSKRSRPSRAAPLPPSPLGPHDVCDALLHLRHHRRSEGRAAHAVDPRRDRCTTRRSSSRRGRTTAACCSSRSPTSAAW